ncbi:MAG: beta-ketoacyl-ACP synthase II [Thermoanaerobaculia bacterium]|nr:beta-ketoacyl-ACP synthase II [Thermoanaerobaculia bacterium]
MADSVSSRPPRRRVAVTGVGLVSPLAVGTEATWDGIVAGRSGIAQITKVDTAAFGFPTTIAGEVLNFDPSEYMDRKEVRRFDTFVHYAVAATTMALDDASFAIDDGNAERVAVMIGTGIGGFPLIEHTKEVLDQRGPRKVSPFFIPGAIANMATGQVSIQFGAKGPNACPVTACATGLHAVGDASRLIMHGYSDYAIAGGSEGAMTPLAIGGFCSTRALSVRNDEPEKASRPWDTGRDGFVMAEGAGVLFLEELEAARERGAHIYAEVVGYGMSGDAYHITAPHPEGDGMIRVMRAAIDDAGIEPAEIGYINAHATSTEVGDVAEVKAIKAVFGDHAKKVAVSSTKSATGHLLGAAGGIEAGFLALAIDRGVLPPTLNLDQPDEGCDLDFVPHQARQARIDLGLTNSFGFGGTNASLVLRRV